MVTPSATLIAFVPKILVISITRALIRASCYICINIKFEALWILTQQINLLAVVFKSQDALMLGGEQSTA